jgi:sialic acid synthase SpsE
MPKIQLGQLEISDDTRPYCIAEIGVNHEGSMERARELIDMAHASGAHAAKFQTYKAETIAARKSPSYWDLNMEPISNQFQLFKKFDMFGQEEYEALATYCSECGIDFLSTPFDFEAVDFLDPLMPFFKIASADITNTPFLEYIAQKNKPVVLSTGAATLAEIDQALLTLRSAGAGEIALLHCILNYPTSDAEANLNMIVGLRRTYPDLVIGYSDHTLPDENMQVLTTSYLKGARIIEKHFTHDRTIKGNDHLHAMTAENLRSFWKNMDRIRDLEGETTKRPLESEGLARTNARRSIVLKRAFAKGHLITKDDITVKRPAHGIPPTFFGDVVGMTLIQDLEEDHILQWSDVAPRTSD